MCKKFMSATDRFLIYAPQCTFVLHIYNTRSQLQIQEGAGEIFRADAPLLENPGSTTDYLSSFFNKHHCEYYARNFLNAMQKV